MSDAATANYWRRRQPIGNSCLLWLPPRLCAAPAVRWVVTDKEDIIVVLVLLAVSMDDASIPTPEKNRIPQLGRIRHTPFF